MTIVPETKNKSLEEIGQLWKTKEQKEKEEKVQEELA